MAWGAITGAAWQLGLTARHRRLLVGGLDVLSQPRAGGNGYGVDWASIELGRAMAGVSSLSFTVDDPEATLTLALGAHVDFRECANTYGYPFFGGFVQAISRSATGVGRVHHVRAIGYDVVLDWARVDAMTLPVGMNLAAAVQVLCANTLNGTYGALRAFVAPAATNGDAQQGIGATINNSNPLADPVYIDRGTTLREALQTVVGANYVGIPWGRYEGTYVTIDMDMVLRVWARDLAGAYGPNDAGTLTLVDAFPLSNTAATSLNVSSDLGDVPAGALVQGGNVTGSGFVPRGSGLPGPIAMVTESSSVSASTRDAVGNAYLSQHQLAARGSLSLPHRDVGQTHGSRQGEPGAALVLTDSVLGLSAQVFAINHIRKTFTSTLETWDVTFGTDPPLLSRALRSLLDA